MTLVEFIEKVKSGVPVSFDETMRVISEHYEYTPVRFTNGLGIQRIVNEAGTNAGSCRIFNFARLNRLTKEQTLGLFGDHFRIDVQRNPEAGNHPNIRAFAEFGWEGIEFEGQALTLKSAEGSKRA